MSAICYQFLASLLSFIELVAASFATLSATSYRIRIGECSTPETAIYMIKYDDCSKIRVIDEIQRYIYKIPSHRM